MNLQTASLAIIFNSISLLAFTQEKKISVYAFVAEECPISIYMASPLHNIAEQYDAQANFYLVFPVATSTEKTAGKFRSKYKLNKFENRLDSDHTITRNYGALVTPEVIVVNEENTILYKGRINDAYLQAGKRKHMNSSNDLELALEFATQGKPLPQPWKKAVGCVITDSN